MIDDTHNERHAFTLRAVADRAGVQPIKHLMRQPGMSAIYRLTIYYHDRRARDTVATLSYVIGQEITLAVAYDGLFHHKSILHRISSERYQDFVLALRKPRFDKLPDQPYLPNYGSDLWMIERAAGSFIKGVIVAPQTAADDYAQLCAVIQTYLPEAFREVK
ncbi:MAG: hypothetical protein K8L99_24895 [Anaerolineae bacterium]|nr:hypothetical protein [Anaerolineae bacterium]